MTAKSLKPSGITADDLVKIITACKENGVSEFHFGEVLIIFSSNSTAPIKDEIYNQYVSHETQEKSEEQEPEAVDQEDLKVQMLIDDPLALEEMVMRGDNQT